MRSIRLIATTATLGMLTACAATQSQPDTAALAAEIQALAADDQRLDRMVMNNDPETNQAGFFERKEILQHKRTERCREIFDRVGFPAPPRFDRKTASDFWLLVQHSDNDPPFQQRVLDAMGTLPDGTVSPDERAYLVDRVRINTGRPQLYGTQSLYDHHQARAFPKPIENPAQVDNRRDDVGLEPLWSYMNDLSELHHTMNRAHYEPKGITEPWQYPEGYSDW